MAMAAAAFVARKSFRSISVFTPCHFTLSNRNIKIPPKLDDDVNVASPELLAITGKYNFSPRTASLLASCASRARNPQNADSVLSFLSEFGFSNAQLDRIVGRYTRLVTADVETIIKPKIKIFLDMGFSASEIAEALAKGPDIFTYSASKRIIPAFSVLMDLLQSHTEVAKLFKRHSASLFFMDLKESMLPNIALLKSCGVPMEQIISHLHSLPGFLCTKPETMRISVDKAERMGVDRRSKAFISAVRVIALMPDETLELKLKAYKDLGVSENDILKMFRTSPQVLITSVQKIKKIAEILLETGKYDISCIVKNPVSLHHSVERFYKPRLQVLKVLEENGLLEEWPSLSKLYGLSNEKFFKKFVAPYRNAKVVKAFDVKPDVGCKG